MANELKVKQNFLEQVAGLLQDEFGKGFSADNLKLMRRFYVIYSQDQIGETVFPQFREYPQVDNGRRFYLSWSHYLKLMRIENVDERHFYEIEAVKDPYVLEFLGLPEKAIYSETELENRIIDHLQSFLLELGTGFTFVDRQVRFTFDEKHFKVDLVFFNRILKCFVLFDLKIGELKHQDIGQMQMYVHYYDRKIKLPEENPTIGVLLCKDKDEAIVELTLPEDNTQIFASRFETVLPDKEALKRLLDEQ